MKSVTETKSLGDIRTATSHHITAKPPLKGTAYLDLYLLDKEKQRLEQELALVQKRQGRINGRLAEIRKSMEKVKEAAQQEQAAQSSLANPATGQQAASIQEHGGRQWKRLAVDY